MHLDKFEKQNYIHNFDNKIHIIINNFLKMKDFHREMNTFHENGTQITSDDINSIFKKFIVSEDISSPINDIIFSVDSNNEERMFFIFSPSIIIGLNFINVKHNFLFKDETKPTLILTPNKTNLEIKGYNSRSYNELIDILELAEITKLDHAIIKIEEFIESKFVKLKEIAENKIKETDRYKISKMVSELKF